MDNFLYFYIDQKINNILYKRIIIHLSRFEFTIVSSYIHTLSNMYELKKYGFSIRYYSS